MPINDNYSPTRELVPAMPDAHGHAALLLVETLIHTLVERCVISNEDAVQIIETANEVQAEIAEAADGDGAPMWLSHALLSSIAASLKLDGDGGKAPR